MDNKILYEYLLNKIYTDSDFNPFYISHYIIYKNKSQLHYEAFDNFINDENIKQTIKIICEKDYITNHNHRKMFLKYNSLEEKIKDFQMLLKRDFFRLFTLYKNLNIETLIE